MKRTRAEERIAALETSAKREPGADEAAPPAASDDDAIARALAERDEYLAALQRERADFTNFRRRTEEAAATERFRAAERLLGRILEIADDLERSVEARPADLAAHPWAEGVAAIGRKVQQLLELEGVTAVEAAPGTAFDPELHEAILAAPGTGRPAGEIVTVFARGYRVGDRVLRPARVVVAVAGDGEDPRRPA